MHNKEVTIYNENTFWANSTYILIEAKIKKAGGMKCHLVWLRMNLKGDEPWQQCTQRRNQMVHDDGGRGRWPLEHWFRRSNAEHRYLQEKTES